MIYILETTTQQKSFSGKQTILGMKVLGKGYKLLNSYLAEQPRIPPWPTSYRSPHHQ